MCGRWNLVRAMRRSALHDHCTSAHATGFSSATFTQPWRL